MTSFKVPDLVTRVAIKPMVEFGEKISSKFQDFTTKCARIPKGSNAEFWKQWRCQRFKIWPLELL